MIYLEATTNQGTYKIEKIREHNLVIARFCNVKQMTDLSVLEDYIGKRIIIIEDDLPKDGRFIIDGVRRDTCCKAKLGSYILTMKQIYN